MINLLALPDGTELVGDYRLERVLGAGGFGITYLAYEASLTRQVTIKEYFPGDFAARDDKADVVARSRDSAEDYQWGLDRFIEEAQTLAKFEHPNIVRVYRYFRANRTAYMVLRFEEGQSFKSWLRTLGRAPRQSEMDAIVTPLLEALDTLHRGDVLHRDIAPDNIMIRKTGEPVLIDFGSARGDIASHSRTVSALVKPGYSPYEQYATRSSQQGAWTDIYALAATLYHAITGKRPPDAPSRVVSDEYVPARDAALSSYRAGFLAAIDKALAVDPKRRPQSIAEWRGPLLAPDPPKARRSLGLFGKAQTNAPPLDQEAVAAAARTSVLPPPDMPQPQGRMLDFIDGLRGKSEARPAESAAAPAGAREVKPKSKAEAATPAASKPSPAHKGGAEPALPPVKGKPSSGTVAAAKAIAPAAASPRAGFNFRRYLRPLIWKLLIGVGIASAAVAFQDQLPRMEVKGFGQVASQSSEAGEVLRLAGHAGPVISARFADGGRSLVSLGVDRTLRIWSAATGATLRTISLGGEVPISLAVAGQRAAVGYGAGDVHLWDIERGQRIAAFKRGNAAVVSIALLSAPDRVAAGSLDGIVTLWEESGAATPLRQLEHGSSVLAIAALSEQRLLLTGGADRALKLWSNDGQALVRTYRGHKDRVTATALAPSGRVIAGGAQDGAIRVWSALSPRFDRLIRGSQSRVGALAFAPGSEVLAAVSDDGAVRLWDHASGRLIKAFLGHAGPARSVAYAPDGTRLATAGDDGTIRIWDAEARPADPRK